MPRVRLVVLAALSLVFSACTALPERQPDRAAFRASRPRSILVLPPVNRSPDVEATRSLLSVTTRPLAEAGYYVIPVTLADETFRQNGVTVADEAHAIDLPRLRQIFGADAGLYVTINRYGVSYRLIDSVVETSASARLVDLRNGQELWRGSVHVSVGNDDNSGSLVGMLLNAVISQVVNSATDRAHVVAGAASQRLLSAGRGNGLLYGPYHPEYAAD